LSIQFKHVDQIASSYLSAEAEEKILCGFLRQDRKSISQANAEKGLAYTSCDAELGTEIGSPTVVFKGFDLRQLVDAAQGKGAQPTITEPESTTEWLDGVTPRLAVDKNDMPIVLHIPGWQKKKSLVSNSAPPQVSRSDFEKSAFNDICMELSKSVPPTFGTGADKGGRNAANVYHRVKGQQRGRILLVTSWHAIGHPVSNSPC
jgi:hypothetical protein